MNAQQVRDAADAFYERIADNFWEEHGIDREEALDGMIAAFQSIGLLSPQQVGGIRFGIKRLAIKERREEERKEEERRAALTPEQREREDKGRELSFRIMGMQNAAQAKIIDQIFRSGPTLSFFSKMK